MADVHAVAKKSNKKSPRKRTSSSQHEARDEDHEDMTSIVERISKYFGVGGMYSSKKRKIETHKDMLPVLNEEILDMKQIKKLPTAEKKRYIDEISPITLQTVTLLREMMKFSYKLHSTDKRQLKDLMVDSLLKNLKTNPTLPLPERYCEMGLWKQVMTVNQQVWRAMETLETEDQQDVNSSKDEKDPTCLLSGATEKEDDSAKEKKTFRDFYMDMITANFSDDLHKLRKDSSLDNKQISTLIDCLETGKDIWSDEEKKLLQCPTVVNINSVTSGPAT